MARKKLLPLGTVVEFTHILKRSQSYDQEQRGTRKMWLPIENSRRCLLPVMRGIIVGYRRLQNGIQGRVYEDELPLDGWTITEAVSCYLVATNLHHAHLRVSPEHVTVVRLPFDAGAARTIEIELGSAVDTLECAIESIQEAALAMGIHMGLDEDDTHTPVQTNTTV